MKRILKFSPGKVLSFGLAVLAALAVATPQAQGSSCTPPPAGLVGWWKGDGTALDSVSANNGVNQNVAYTNGVVGQAFACDPENFSYGTYTGIQVADRPVYALTNALTIEAWLRPRGDGYVIFFRGDHRPGLDPYALSMQANNTLRFNVCDAAGNSEFVETTVNYFAWTHVAARLDGSTGTLSLYTNGVLAAQTNTTVRPFGDLLPDQSPGIGIGNVNDGGNNFPFIGDIDEIALYGRALTPAEIQAIYNAGSAGKCGPVATACTPPPAGLVSWWPGEINANDVVGGNNGTWTETGSFNTYGPGMVSQAFVFDGTHRDRVDVGNPTNLRLQDFTIEAWVKRASATVVSLDENFADGSIAGPGAYIFGYGAGGYALALLDDGAVALTKNSVGGTLVPPAVTDTNWHHVTVTKSGTTVVFYVDGVRQPAPTPSPYTDTFQFTSSAAIGSRGDGGGNTFYGMIDELAVYNLALSSNEIAAIYNAGSAGKCTATPSAVPAISSFMPASGTNGTVVTIAGLNFSPMAASNLVYFGAVRANVLAASPTSLTVTVPTGATYAPITVTINGFIAYASRPFLVTFAGGSTNGSAALAPRLDLPANAGPGFTAFADLDGDGRPDLLVCSGGSVSIYQNLGPNGTVTAGSFAPRVDLALPAGLDAMTVADVDGDGKLDIVLLNNNSNQVMILKNLSTPGSLTTSSFAAPVVFSAGNSPRGLAVQDLDGDGRPELIVANWGDSTVSIYHNTGAGGLTTSSFAPAVSFAVGASPQGLAVADLDGDGQPDIVTANNNYGTDSSVSILRNTSSLGNISFAPHVDLTGLPTSFCVAIGDLDGDGKLDLAVSSFINGQAVSVYRNTSTPGSLTTNSFAPHVDFSTGGWGNAVAIGDLDGDGKPDLAVVTQLPDHLSIFKNISTPGSFTASSLAPRVDYSTGWNPNGVAIGDLDGDGRPDIAFAVSYAATLSIYQNQTPFAAPTPTPSCAPAPAGIVGWWPGEGNANDSAGANNGVLSSSGATYASGKVGLGFRFDGTNGYVQIPDSDSLKPTNITCEAWIWLDPSLPTDRGGEQIIFKQNTWTAWFEGYSLLKTTIDNGDGTYSEHFQFCVSRSGNQVAINSRTIVQRGVWYHVAATYNGNQSVLYVNGVAEVSATPGFPLDYGSNPVFIGTSGTFPPYLSMFGGIIDEPSIYNRALSTNEIATIYLAGSGGKCVGIAPPTPPKILSQTPNQVVLLGKAATFSVTASGTDPLSYFWQRNGVLILNATNSSYTLLNAQLSDSGSKFSCLVTNAQASASSTNVTLKVIDTIANDLCSGAILITSASYTNVQSTLKASSFGDPVPGCVDGFGHGVWYQFTAPVNGQLIVDTFGSDFDTGLAIYTGSCDALTEVACNDDTGGVTSQVTIPTTAGTTYSILAGGYSSDAGNLVLHLNHLTSPAFAMQPADQSVVTGSNASFSATLTGAVPMNFQWNFNGTPLVDDGMHVAGSLTRSLILSNVTTADAGSYTLAVTNFLGATNSTAAVLTVLVPPTITTQPVGRSVPPGLPTTFNAAASGIPTPGYQWQLNGTNIPGATSSSYTNAAVGTDDLGFYHLVASNSVGVAVSADAQLTFGPVAAWGRNLSGECLPPPGLSNVVAVAGVFGASYAVRTDGTMIAWGDHNKTNLPASASNVVAISTSENAVSYALRANGTVISLPSGNAVGLSNIVSVAAGFGFAYALRADGTTTNFSGKAPGFPAALPAGLNHVTAIACGYSSALALRSDGTVVIAGVDAINNVPAGLTNVVAIAAGYSYAMALKADGKLVAWGSGTGTNLSAGMTNIVAIAAGNYTLNAGLAIRADGTVVAWGDNIYGEKTPPAALSNLVSIAVSAPAYHGLALVNDGRPVILHPPIGLTAYTGRDVTLHGDAAGAQPLSYQWLLDGTNLPGATGTSLVISNVQFSNAGNYQLFVSNSVNTALSLPAPLTVVSNSSLTFLSQPTGSQTNYQGGKVTLGVTVLGSGPLRYQWFFSPTNKNYTAFPGATNDTLALDPALVVQSGNYYISVSNQISGITSAPVSIKVLFAKTWGYLATDPPFNVSNATAIAVGNAGQSSLLGHYLVLKADGKISSWSGGSVSYGETNVAALSNSTVTAIAAGYQDSLALKSDGTVYAWGFNAYGETNVPAGLNGVTAIACGDYHDLALKSDGTIAGWGQSTYQQTTNTAATNVVAIAAGGANSIALRADGSVVSWGQYGQQYTRPTTATNVIAVAAGGTHFLALRADGTVVGWGSNPYGQITIPASWSNIVAISASANHSIALRNDGTVLKLGVYNGSTAITPPADLANVIAIASGGERDLALFGTRAPAFTVQPWNRAININPKQASSITLVGKCAGVQPMRYQWLLNGTNYPGATNDSLTLAFNYPTGTTKIPPGTYQLVASNAYGVAISKPAKVTLFIPLGDALDATNLNWTTSGNAPWFGQTNYVHPVAGAVNSSAARSGGIGALQETILQTTFATSVAGSVIFWWKVSSEQFFDTLEFRINGTVQASISGEVDWTQASFPLAAGTNVLMWRYSKDVSFDSGLDAGFVDQFVFATPPNLTRQPASRTNYQGTTASFVVSASGASPLTYQWRKNGTNLVNTANVSGVTTPSLTLSAVGYPDAGSYTVVITNLGGSVTSSPALLTVLDGRPSIVSSPVSLTNNAGTPATFAVTATGGLPLNYQWQKNGMSLLDGGNVSGLATSLLTLANVQRNDAATYTVIVTNNYGSLTSSPALLAVIDVSPTITSQPVNCANLPGKAVAFSVAAMGTTPLSYQWQFNGTNLAGATNSTLALASIAKSNAGPYQVIVTNRLGSTTSAVATLTVLRTMIIAWGANTYGQTNVPAPLPDITTISAGWRHNLALQNDGQVAAWGYNGNCTVGVPPGLSNVVAVSAGGGWGLALKSDGSVVGLECAGIDDSTYWQVSGLSNITAVAAGWYHWLALKSDGSLATFSVANDSYTPTNLPAGLTNVTAIAAGDEYSVALKADGTVVAWGGNNYGQTNVPTGLSNVIAIAASSVADHTLALKRDGTVVAWGLDYSGQTGVPAGLSNVVAIAVGQQHSLALKADGTVVAWGTNAYYTVDPGMTQIPAGLSNVIAIGAGEAHSVALVNDGSPAILRQPVSQTVSSNTAVHFSVTALGAPSLTYQWKKNGVNLTDGGSVSGAATATLTVSNVQSADMAIYTVGITNTIDNAISAPAALVIAGPPVITLQPVSQTMNLGTNVQFSVAAIGNPSPAYRWLWNGTNPVGGNSPTLTLTSVGRAQNGVYSVLVTNTLGGIFSSNVVLKVIVPQLLGSSRLLPDGSFQLTSTDANGGLLSPADLVNFEVQVSTNLVNWATLPDGLSLTNGHLQLQDNGRTNSPSRFYRIVEH